MTQANSNALQIIIDEFKNISPDIKNAYIFSKNCETIASTELASEYQTKRFLAAFNLVADQAATIGGVETLTIQGTDNQLNVQCLNDRYLATVYSKTVDEKVIRALNKVIIPTVMSLIDQIGSKQASEPLTEQPIPEIETENKPIEAAALLNESTDEEDLPLVPDTVLPPPSANQFMVEKISGLLIPPDTVRVDSEVISVWNDLYGQNQITQVLIETLEGEETTCKFKPIKQEKQSVKGVIQLPEKILQMLHTSSGKLVLVKPVVT